MLGDFSPDCAVLLAHEMARADKLTIESGLRSGFELMESAGAAVMDVVLSAYPDAARIGILCGPGNNGGDGYVVARLLRERGCAPTVFAMGEPRPGSDAALARARFAGPVQPLATADLDAFDLLVDALLGTGLDRPLEGELAAIITAINRSGVRVVSVDLPSGLSADGRLLDGPCLEADRTVTFFKQKPVHLLEPCRSACGIVDVAQIGIDERVLNAIQPNQFRNGLSVFVDHLPRPGASTHKYSRGAVAVISGPVGKTGAARLSALAALRAGAGACTLIAEPEAVPEIAAHMSAIMINVQDRDHDLAALTQDGKLGAIVIGPGHGLGPPLARRLEALISGSHALVLDADALTQMAGIDGAMSAMLKTRKAPTVLTPHAGEFGRLFPDLVTGPDQSKLDCARAAALRSGCVVVYKGSDTVIAAPNGRAAINTNAPATLATAGSGDVLAGLLGGLLAQGMPAFEAACAAVYVHGEAGRLGGTHLTADDLPDLVGQAMDDLILPPVLR